MEEDKIVHLRVVAGTGGANDDNDESDTTDEELLAEHKIMVEALMADGPFEFILGVARRRDGSFMTFSTSMDIRDYVFACEVMKVQSLSLLADAIDG